jgi:monoamine oxidase
VNDAERAVRLLMNWCEFGVRYVPEPPPNSGGSWVATRIWRKDMPSQVKSVLSTVTTSMYRLGTNKLSVNLSDADYDRLIRALKREDALRKFAYSFMDGAFGYSGNHDQIAKALAEGLGQRITVEEAMEEIKSLAERSDLLGAEYVKERLQKITARMK